MAREAMVKVTCDRCKKKYDEQAEAPSRDGIFIDAKALGLGERVLQDLDPKCEKRVTDLLSLVFMVKADEDEEPATAA